MKQKLTAGAELDILSGEEWKAGQLKLIETIRQQSKKPLIRTLSQKVDTTSAAGLIVMESESPPTGRAWELRRFTIAGADTRAITTLTTGYFVYKTSEAPSNFLDWSTQIPNVSVWDEGQLLLYPGDRLIVVIVGGPATQQIALTLQGIDHDLNRGPVPD
jgi:hypothetical protein